ncbi:WW domain-containing protein C660.06-like [Penaeus japonicus]|uniref:WW domain-containing protein C660.06-like n=1 Tax=Penaeus japonicus TaxID=27405 RepID=UPI001C713A02|nr:WW domain-containing protein C660.06-like [Penaeus japonicus]
MKLLVLIFSVVTGTLARPQGYSLIPPSGPSFAPLTPRRCNDGQVLHVDGKCVTPRINRRVFLYDVPKTPAPVGPPPFIPAPTVETNILFIRSPEGGLGPDPIVVPPPQQEHVVYILNKQSEEGQKVIQIPAPPPSDPDVYFVNYAEGENPTLPSGVDLQTALDAASVNNGPSDFTTSTAGIPNGFGSSNGAGGSIGIENSNGFGGRNGFSSSIQSSNNGFESSNGVGSSGVLRINNGIGSSSNFGRSNGQEGISSFESGNGFRTNGFEGSLPGTNGGFASTALGGSNGFGINNGFVGTNGFVGNNGFENSISQGGSNGFGFGSSNSIESTSVLGNSNNGFGLNGGSGIVTLPSNGQVSSLPHIKVYLASLCNLKV